VREKDGVGVPEEDDVGVPEEAGAGMKIRTGPLSVEYRWECLMMLEIY